MLATDDQLDEFLDLAPFRFASSMPRWPHYYVRLADVASWGEAQWRELVRRCVDEGEDEPWGGRGTGARLRIVRYYRRGGWRYWCMTRDKAEATLVNRAWEG